MENLENISEPELTELYTLPENTKFNVSSRIWEKEIHQKM